MRKKLFAIVTIAAFVFTSCDDTTNNLGSTLISDMDNLEISTQNFLVSTQSIAANTILSRSTIGFLGKVKDLETGGYITSNFMTQFHVLENFTLPKAELMSKKEDNMIVADSCELRINYNSFYGDSLAPMKVVAYEMSKPMTENRMYYSDFDPIKEGYIAKNGLKAEQMYTLTSQDKNYKHPIKIKMNMPYTDKVGKVYKNIGTYIINMYYQHPEYFKNSFTFAQYVVPGFYFKNESGIGSMVYAQLAQLNIYFSYKHKGKVETGIVSFTGTEEVLQTSTIINDQHSIQKLVNDNSKTYLKSPAGIFTEITIPVDNILKGHERDAINSAKIQLLRINNQTNNKFALPTPKTLLLVQKDSLNAFFAHKHIADYKTSFLSTYDQTLNGYTFPNIANVINQMKRNKDTGKASANWNKLVVVPVTTLYYTSGQSNILLSVNHDMSLTSTQLIGGNNKLTLNVIYSHFK